MSTVESIGPDGGGGESLTPSSHVDTSNSQPQSQSHTQETEDLFMTSESSDSTDGDTDEEDAHTFLRTEFVSSSASSSPPSPSQFSTFDISQLFDYRFVTLITLIVVITLMIYRPVDTNRMALQSSKLRMIRGKYPNRELSDNMIKTIEIEMMTRKRQTFLPTLPSTPSSSVGSKNTSDSVTDPCPPPPSTPTVSPDPLPGCTPLSSIPPPPVPQPKSVTWKRSEFVAPLPKDPLKLRDGSVRPLAKSPIEMADQFKKWEGEFAQLLGRQNGQLNENVMKTFYEYLHSAVDPLEVRAEPIHTVDQAVTILDGRKDPMVIFGLKHTFNLLGPGWGLVFFHTSDNEEWIIDQLKIRPGEAGEHIQLRRVQPVLYEQANSLAMSSIFHDTIPVETILLVQPDAFMLRSPWFGTKDDRDTWNDLLAKNAYLGAPWGWCSEDWCRAGGNGGISMRKRSIMKSVLAEIRCDRWACDLFDEYIEGNKRSGYQQAEDTALSFFLHSHLKRLQGHIPPQTRMGEFSLEHMEVPSANPFFVHKVWNYQSQQRWLPLLAHAKQYYPELW